MYLAEIGIRRQQISDLPGRELLLTVLTLKLCHSGYLHNTEMYNKNEKLNCYNSSARIVFEQFKNDSTIRNIHLIWKQYHSVSFE